MKVKRDNGREIGVDWEVEEHSEQGNGWDDPGHGSVVYLTEALDGDVDVLADLSGPERDRIEVECAAAQDEYDMEPDD